MPSHLSVLFQGIAVGGTVQAVLKTILAPFERTRLLLQVQAASPQIPKGKEYKGIVDCLIRIPREQGFVSFWRGNLAQVIAAFSFQTLVFACNGAYNQVFLVGFNGDTQSSRYVAGSLAVGGATGATVLCLVYPLNLVVTRLAADVGSASTREFTGFRNCIASITLSDGVGGLYRGFLTAVQGIVVYRAVYFGFLNGLNAMLPEPEKTSVFVNWLIAETVVVLSGLMSYPFDTVCKRMMMQSGRTGTDLTYKNSIDCWKKIYESEGIRGFYKGALISILVGTSGALLLVASNQLSQA